MTPSTLKSLGPDLFALDGEVRVPGLTLPARMTIVRLADGSVALHSPLAIDEAVAAAIDALGPVRFLIAPNQYHHLFAGPSKQRYPDAKLLGAEGLADKRPDLPWDGALPAAGDPFGDGTVEVRRIDGMPKMNEVAFFHRPSRALIVTDLLFNVVTSPYWTTRAALRLISGVYGRCGVSNLVKREVKDRAAASMSVRALLAWEPARLVMAHGEPMDADVPAVLARELAWFLS
jgi:hypothetical protein